MKSLSFIENNFYRRKGTHTIYQYIGQTEDGRYMFKNFTSKGSNNIVYLNFIGVAFLEFYGESL